MKKIKRKNKDISKNNRHCREAKGREGSGTGTICESEKNGKKVIIKRKGIEGRERGEGRMLDRKEKIIYK